MPKVKAQVCCSMFKNAVSLSALLWLATFPSLCEVTQARPFFSSCSPEGEQSVEKIATEEEKQKQKQRRSGYVAS
jgi:hypothetical protein